MAHLSLSLKSSVATKEGRRGKERQGLHTREVSWKSIRQNMASWTMPEQNGRAWSGKRRHEKRHRTESGQRGFRTQHCMGGWLQKQHSVMVREWIALNSDPKARAFHFKERDRRGSLCFRKAPQNFTIFWGNSPGCKKFKNRKENGLKVLSHWVSISRSVRSQSTSLLPSLFKLDTVEEAETKLNSYERHRRVGGVKYSWWEDYKQSLKEPLPPPSTF